MSKMKEQNRIPEKQLNEAKVVNVPGKEFRIMKVKMIHHLRNKWGQRLRKYKKCLTKI